MSRFIHHVALAGGALAMLSGLAAAAPPVGRLVVPGIGGSGAFPTFTPTRPATPIMSGGYVITNTMNRPFTDMPGRDPRTWSPTDIPGRDPRTWSPYPLYPQYRPYGSLDYWLLNPYWRDQYHPSPYPNPFPNPYADVYPDYLGRSLSR